jgi:PKHD-type hydroxylase
MHIAGLLDPATLAAIRATLSDRTLFQPGRATAGWHAREVKHNEQARAGTLVDGILRKVEQALLANEVLVATARPKRLVRLLVSRYETGMAYGAHVDDALMDGMRTDLSFTLFLSEPDSYDGGELMIEDSSGERAVKLPAGDLVLYPSTTLHRVAPVTRGERLAVVGWVRSLIRDAGQREILLDLETVLRELFGREGKSRTFDLLAKTRTNLLRMWAED